MTAKKKSEIQYRYYDMPPDSYALALLGVGWLREYTQGVDELHFHNYLEIGYCHGGHGNLHLNDEVRPFSAHMFSIIPPHYLHSTLSAPDTKSHWEYLFVDVEGLLDKMCGDNISRATDMTERVYRDAVFLHNHENPEVEHLILAIMEEYRAKGEMYLECAEYMLCSLVVKIAQMQKDANKKSIPHGQNHLMIVGALQYVQENYMRKIKVQELAEACSLSETHFRRIFTEYMSMSPLAYVNLIRIEMACKMLRTSGDPVSDIAERCGFTTVTSFNRNFKEIIGVVPLQWRKNTAYYERKLDDQKVLAFHGWL